MGQSQLYTCWPLSAAQKSIIEEDWIQVRYLPRHSGKPGGWHVRDRGGSCLMSSSDQELQQNRGEVSVKLSD